ncbi:type II secretion system protein [bacterium]|nr:type II secretion system protein [bacterium]
MLKNKNGFTLAEVMVTLVVLGVLASIVLPTISKARPNKNKAMFKKAYYVAERIVYELVNDDDLYPSSSNTSGLDNTREVIYLNQQYGSDTDDEDNKKKKFCELFARKVNTTTDTPSCTADNAAFTGVPSFVTTDGVAWYMPYSKFDSTQTIYVDVNGEEQPNCSNGYESYVDCPNPDRFSIKVKADGKLFVEGPKEQEYLSTNNTLR